MDPLKEDNARVNVKSLVSTFIDKELAGTSAGSKDKGIRESKPESTHLSSVSERSYEFGKPHFSEKTPGSKHLKTASERSYEFGTPHFSEKKPGSTHFKTASERSYEFGTPHFSGKTPGSKHLKTASERSYEFGTPHFSENKHLASASERSYEFGTPHFSEKKPWSKHLKTASERSYEFGTPHFRGERPDDYSDYKTEVSSVDITRDNDHTILQTPRSTSNGYWTGKCEQSIEDPPLKGEQKREPFGIPQRWGGHVVSNLNPPKPVIQYPPAVVYPVLTANHRADFVHNRWDHPETAKPTILSDTSDSPTRTLRRDSHYDERTVSNDDIEEEVICDICCRAPALKICLTCNSSYCGYDAKEHYTVKALQRHVLRDVSEEVERKRCRHYKESQDFFCRTDQMPICRICAQGNHKGHDIVSQKISDGDQKPNPGEVVPPPGKIKFLTVKPNSVVLSWGCPQGLEGPKSFRLKWRSSPEAEGCLVVKDLLKIEINGLQIGQEYVFSVATEDDDGNLSEWTTASVFTVPPPPRHLTKVHSEAKAFSLKWTKGDNMEGISHQFLIRVIRPGKDQLVEHTKDCFKMFSDLEPDTEYTVFVSTVLNNQCSESISTTIHTESHLREVLSKIGLEDQYDNKLTLSTFLEINQNDTRESKLDTAQSLPEAFLKKLMVLNANARSVRCVSPDVDSVKCDGINPLDLIIALFLCSDSFLHQNLVLKMSLCQFAIPLLMPNCETREVTLMLWSMREIVKTFRPSSYAFRKSSCEERIVLSDIPLVSFVRLGTMARSKSQMLNKLFSNTQQHHDTFYHHDMVCGDVPRRISDGLVEISWCLPCGDRNIDKFREPLAVANLRGDIRASDKQFSFLCQTSAVVYIFCDESEADYFKNLEGKDVKANLVLISSAKGKTFTLKTMTLKPSLKTTNLSQKKKTDTELIKALHESIFKALENCPNTVPVVNMADRARCCGILVDEDSDECQSVWENASKLSRPVTNTSLFKDKHLASQGFIWKELSWLETECWRLRKVGNQNTEDYRKSLKTREKELRRKQLRFRMTAAMSSFLNGMGTSEVERYYFLKWLEMDLDDLSRSQLSALQDRYRELRQKLPRDAEKIAETDKQISVCSLRLEHFFRECGQLYECASYLPEHSRQRKIVEQLPALCAQMLLDGFPLELVDGDAANIPMKWIAEVLTELHYIMQSNSKLKVITIIGAESSGKSTLLNTMFGVSFATSKGTCTRGAFMQLITVNKDVTEEMGCDCIVIIDTEGLKPHQMVRDDHSHERDKEVASLAVALSDVAIVNISTDDSSEEGILEMVCHALTRLKDVGTKPLCHFVQSNMSDRPAVERRNKSLVEKLNKMILKSTRMKKANVTEISDVMEFDQDTCSWHIPPLWHGTPPMAPVSVDYSEIVHALKKRLLEDLKKCQERGDLTDFITRVENFWRAL